MLCPLPMEERNAAVMCAMETECLVNIGLRQAYWSMMRLVS